MERSGRSLGEGREIGARGGEASDDSFCVAKEELARLGQRYASRPARPLDETNAGDPLEGRDLLAHRGLRVPEPRRGAGEGSLARDGLERRKVAHLDA